MLRWTEHDDGGKEQRERDTGKRGRSWGPDPAWVISIVRNVGPSRARLTFPSSGRSSVAWRTLTLISSFEPMTTPNVLADHDG